MLWTPSTLFGQSQKKHSPKFDAEVPRTIALCSDIGPMFLPASGGGVSDVPKLTAPCLKADIAGWSNIIDYRFKGDPTPTERRYVSAAKNSAKTPGAVVVLSSEFSELPRTPLNGSPTSEYFPSTHSGEYRSNSQGATYGCAPRRPQRGEDPGTE